MSLDQIFLANILLPLSASLFLGLNFILQRYWNELSLIKYVRFFLLSGLLLSLYIVASMYWNGLSQLTLNLGHWFEIEDYHFDLIFHLDKLSAPFVVLIYLLSNIIGRYSANYLIGEFGVHRFFFLLLLFSTSIITVVTAGSIDLVFIGWELVGLTSVLLIGFYSKREISVKYSFKALIAYRIGDVGLLSAAILVHYFTHTADLINIFQGTWPHQTLKIIPTYPTAFCLLIILASIGKSSQFPLCGWLPRAMEGPTPSSAIFYGALSVHLGPYLLLRMWPFFEHSNYAKITVLIIGFITTVYGTLVGRTRCDVKTTLAYATMSQLGIIFIEVALGLHYFALIHIWGHACLRTLQYLRSSSVLQDFVSNPHVFVDRSQDLSMIEKCLPQRLRNMLYYAALDGFYLDTFIIKFIQLPGLKLLQQMKRVEEFLIRLPLREKNHD